MTKGNESHLKAIVQTAPQSGRYVWIITLVDFDAGQIKRSIVSDDTFTTSDAARVAGDAQLRAMSEDR